MSILLEPDDWHPGVAKLAGQPKPIAIHPFADVPARMELNFSPSLDDVSDETLPSSELLARLAQSEYKRGTVFLKSRSSIYSSDPFAHASSFSSADLSSDNNNNNLDTSAASSSPSNPEMAVIEDPLNVWVQSSNNSQAQLELTSSQSQANPEEMRGILRRRRSWLESSSRNLLFYGLLQKRGHLLPTWRLRRFVLWREDRKKASFMDFFSAASTAAAATQPVICLDYFDHLSELKGRFETTPSEVRLYRELDENDSPYPHGFSLFRTTDGYLMSLAAETENDLLDWIDAFALLGVPIEPGVAPSFSDWVLEAVGLAAAPVANASTPAQEVKPRSLSSIQREDRMIALSKKLDQTRPWRSYKLVIVGDAGAGKTAFRNALERAAAFEEVCGSQKRFSAAEKEASSPNQGERIHPETTRGEATRDETTHEGMGETIPAPPHRPSNLSYLLLRFLALRDEPSRSGEPSEVAEHSEHPDHPRSSDSTPVPFSLHVWEMSSDPRLTSIQSLLFAEKHTLFAFVFDISRPLSDSIPAITQNVRLAELQLGSPQIILIGTHMDLLSTAEAESRCKQVLDQSIQLFGKSIHGVLCMAASSPVEVHLQMLLTLAKILLKLTDAPLYPIGYRRFSRMIHQLRFEVLLTGAIPVFPLRKLRKFSMEVLAARNSLDSQRLMELLHDLGILLSLRHNVPLKGGLSHPAVHFDTQIGNCCILDPLWVISVCSLLFEASQYRGRATGLLSKEDLRNIWKEPDYSSHLAPPLLRLLSRFEFMYEISVDRIRHIETPPASAETMYFIPSLVERLTRAPEEGVRNHVLIEPYRNRSSLIYQRFFFLFPLDQPAANESTPALAPFGIFSLILLRLLRYISQLQLLVVRPDGSFVVGLKGDGFVAQSPTVARLSPPRALTLPQDMGPAPPPPGQSSQNFDKFFIIECQRRMESQPPFTKLSPCIELIVRKPVVIHTPAMIQAQAAFLLAVSCAVISQTTSQFFHLGVRMYLFTSLGARSIKILNDDIYESMLTLGASPSSKENLCVTVKDARRSHQLPIFHFAPDIMLSDVEAQLASLQDVDFTPEPLFQTSFLNVHLGNWREHPSTFIVLRSKTADDTPEVLQQRITTLQAFSYEVILLSQLQHPCIMSMRAYTIQPQSLVLEMLEFGSLEYLLDAQRALDQPLHPTIAFTIASDIATGMAFLHQMDVLHSRLTPRSVHLSKVPLHLGSLSPSPVRAKICGFGPLTKGMFSFNEESEPLKRRVWSAPELFQGDYQRKISPTRACDVYSFGLLLYCLFSNSDPFVSYGISSVPVLEEFLIAGGRPHIPPDTPPSISRLMRNCWQEWYDQRPSFSSVCGELEPLVSVLSRCYLPQALKPQPQPSSPSSPAPSSSPLIIDDGFTEPSNDPSMMLRHSFACLEEFVNPDH
ncbi:MAG: protein kinase [archaeon]|nr:protein kinase [archaeon]